LGEIKDMNAKIDELKNVVKDREAEHKLKAMACDVLDPKVGLPIYLIDTKIPELEDGINRYIDFFGTVGLSISLETKTANGDETLAVLVDNGKNPILDVASYSGGQHDSIEVCLKMALADLAEKMRDTSLGLLAFDEPGVHLDEGKKAKLVELIHERAISGRTPVSIVISHDRKLMSGFRRRFALRKEESGTVLDPI
jgi:DNA repair exonuclease SbcCD ATPase subunit